MVYSCTLMATVGVKWLKTQLLKVTDPPLLPPYTLPPVLTLKEHGMKEFRKIAVLDFKATVPQTTKATDHKSDGPN